jgi:hypothetical protein
MTRIGYRNDWSRMKNTMLRLSIVRAGTRYTVIAYTYCILLLLLLLLLFYLVKLSFSISTATANRFGPNVLMRGISFYSTFFFIFLFTYFSFRGLGSRTYE